MPPDNHALWYDYETEEEVKRRPPYWWLTAIVIVFTLAALNFFV